MGQDKKQKLSRKERERRMIAEMDAAMWGNKVPDENADKTKGENKADKQARNATKSKKNAGQKLHCPRCKTLMENGKCPNCGHYIYVPMDKEKRSKIRLIIGGVCVIGFLILFFALQGKK